MKFNAEKLSGWMLGIALLAGVNGNVIQKELMCDTVTCPVLDNVADHRLDVGERIVFNKTGCCTTLSVVCDQKLCLSKPPRCPDVNMEIEEIQGKCCTKYECVPPKDKCIFDSGDEVEILQLNESRETPDPCVQIHCVLNAATQLPKLENLQVQCMEQCEAGYQYQHLDEANCCGECVQSECVLENAVYQVGEHWRSPDNCTLYECTEMDGLLEVTSFRKTCPEFPMDCPPENAYMKDCCKMCRESAGNKKSEYIGAASEIDLTEADTYQNHPCSRDCVAGEEPRMCHYTFTIEWYETLSKACYECPFNTTDCNRPHCIGVDGARRSIVVVNRQMPGPSIDVCKGDTIVVDVKNHLMGESTTIHWHGLHQRANPYMDGVPHISQCPILPHTTFRYTFEADSPGTHFWHSHTGMQRGDGAFGPLIIREATDPHAKLYDYDLLEHVISLNDWAHETGISMFSSHHHSLGDNKPPNLLINGKGRIFEREPRFLDEAEAITDAPPDMEISTLQRDRRDLNVKHRERVLKATEESKRMPLAEFTVEKNYRYRFRVINAGFLNCPIELSIDNHNLTVITSDGFGIQPLEVATLVIYAGERFDFVLNANRKIQSYWVRFRGLMDCDERFTSAHQVAVLRYVGSRKPPSGIPSYNYVREGLQLNALNKGSGEEMTRSIAEVDSIAEDNFALLREPDHKFFVYYDFYPKDNPHFHMQGLYGFNQINNSNSKLFTPQLNHISMKMPSLAMMPAKDYLDESTFCNETSLAGKGINCREEFCECSHVLQVPLHSTVELILIDEGVTYDANHPFHLHGNAFRVVAMERLGKSVKVEDVKRLDAQGKIHRRLKNAPIKDTVTVPDGGYTIVRFVADNPGYWLLHCHIEFHAEIGMALVLKIGDKKEMAPVPVGFPTCHDYMPDPLAVDVDTTTTEKEINASIVLADPETSRSSKRETDLIKIVLSNVIIFVMYSWHRLA